MSKIAKMFRITEEVNNMFNDLVATDMVLRPSQLFSRLVIDETKRKILKGELLPQKKDDDLVLHPDQIMNPNKYITREEYEALMSI